MTGRRESEERTRWRQGLVEFEMWGPCFISLVNLVDAQSLSPVPYLDAGPGRLEGNPPATWMAVMYTPWPKLGQAGAWTLLIARSSGGPTQGRGIVARPWPQGLANGVTCDMGVTWRDNGSGRGAVGRPRPVPVGQLRERSIDRIFPSEHEIAPTVSNKTGVGVHHRLVFFPTLLHLHLNTRTQ